MNKSSYNIGDRIPNTRFEVCGKMITSTGTVRYWLKAFDNTVVVNEHELELVCAIASDEVLKSGRS